MFGLEALLPVILNLVGTYAPTITGMLLGPKAAEVATTVTNITKSVFGTTDPAAVADAAKNDPALVQFFIERVKAETEQYKASLLDVQDARSQTVKLVASGSVIAWGSPAMSVIVVVGFIAVLILWMFHPATSDPVLNILVGSLAASFVQVVSYWLGSSAGSRDKDAFLGTALANSQANTQTAMRNGK